MKRKMEMKNRSYRYGKNRTRSRNERKYTNLKNTHF